MMRDNSPTVDQYWEALAQVLPSFTAAEGRAALTLYRELAKGKPVDAEQLGKALGVTPAEARAVLDRDSLKRSVYANDQGRVVGFGGLAIAPTHHRFEVDGRALWTWCAWDTLFLPERLGERARVVSPDPESGQMVELVLTPHEIESVQPEDAVVSFLLPDAREFTSAANTIAKFCHFVFFFTSRASGERWVAKHPGTFLYTVKDAFELARRANAKHFGSELPRRAADTPIACSLTGGFKDRLAWIGALATLMSRVGGGAW